MKAHAVTIIPARGGSKRFPRKNIANFNGNPLIANAIEKARAATSIKEVFVSTEDREICEIAKRFGASVPIMRDSDLADDYSTIDQVASDFLKRIQKKIKYKIDCVVLLQPTSPFVLPEQIDACVSLLRNNAKLTSVTTVSKLDNRHHPFNIGKQKSKMEWCFIDEKNREKYKTRQSKPKRFKFANLFVVRAEVLRKPDRFGDQKGFIEVDDIFSTDIDCPIDLKIAELISREITIK